MVAGVGLDDAAGGGECGEALVEGGGADAAAVTQLREWHGTAGVGERGYDAAKKVLGRKRHVAVDSGGRLLAVGVTTADVQDQDGGIVLVRRLVRLCPWVRTVVVDGGYTVF